MRLDYPGGVIGSTVGTYHRGTGSNPVEGNGCFSPHYHTVSSVFRYCRTHTHTRARARTHTHTSRQSFRILSQYSSLHRFTSITIISITLPIAVEGSSKRYTGTTRQVSSSSLTGEDLLSPTRKKSFHILPPRRKACLSVEHRSVGRPSSLRSSNRMTLRRRADIHTQNLEQTRLLCQFKL